MRVSVIGGGTVTDEQAARAEAVGRELAGGVGTLTEIGFAGIYDRPVVGLETHDVSDIDIDLETVSSPEAAVDTVEAALEREP
ncbi:hypothetical protein RBH26_07500 [Natronolimnohabitans sp. A-GB9]|uniref:hypothetical protein n=1 Tax=Natronolimnohabitans sp. A-GB9 TaxID=3069757 RepID=UPI0027B191B0|nr:hypothetical protein [Natronolimnohabitans sp. A-GB9]MDQ2050328.1 hypothetical protein [Natronolimnohabitans sp. A-GB9]